MIYFLEVFTTYVTFEYCVEDLEGSGSGRQFIYTILIDILQIFKTIFFVQVCKQFNSSEL